MHLERTHCCIYPVDLEDAYSGFDVTEVGLLFVLGPCYFEPIEIKTQQSSTCADPSIKPPNITLR